MSCLVKGICHSKSLNFDWCIPGFCRMGESTTHQSDFPSMLSAKRLVDEKEQCFWKSPKPRPSLDQSVAKIFTLLAISVVITVLDSSNNWSSLLSQRNGKVGLSKSLNGSIHSAMLKAYDTWLSRPNQDLTSVIFLGAGNSVIALRYLLQGHGLSQIQQILQHLEHK